MNSFQVISLLSLYEIRLLNVMALKVFKNILALDARSCNCTERLYPAKSFANF